MDDLIKQQLVLMNQSTSHKISKREKEVLVFLSQGYTTIEIASRLFLSIETIKSHRKNLLAKLQAKNAFQLGYKANALNIIPYSS